MEIGLSYARASQDRTGEELSVARQHEDQRKLASGRGIRLAAEVTDNDVSAAGKRKRPGFERALEMVGAGEVSVIIATDMSRLTRGKAQDEARLLEMGLETGLKLMFVRAPDLDLSTAAGRLTASILIAAARHEIEQKSERQKRAAVQAAEAGKRIGGRRPFGYEDDGTTIRENEAEAIRWAFREVLAGLPLAAVAREWNGRGLTTPQYAYAHGCDGTCASNVKPRACPQRRQDRPSTWTAQTAGPVLLNPRYAGFRVHVTDEIRKRYSDPRKARIAAIVGPAEWPALIDENTWRAAVAVLTDPGRAKPAKLGQRMMTGEGLCGVCDATVHASGAAAPRGVRSYPMYRCSASTGHVGRMADPVDWFVGEVVIARMARPDAGDLLRPAVDRPGADEVGQQLLALRTRRREVLSLVKDGLFTAAEARSEVADLDRQIGEAEASLADTGRASVLGPLVAAEGVDEVRAAWEAMDNDRKRAVIGALMTVRLLPPGRGVRLGRTVPEWEANAERIRDSLLILWHD